MQIVMKKGEVQGAKGVDGDVKNLHPLSIIPTNIMLRKLRYALAHLHV
jgi:hypothetical protein